MGQRWLKFRAWLNATRASVDEINVVYYERATQLPNQHSAAHIYGGFLAMIEVWAEVNNVRLVAVSPMTIKKFWTGTGRAKKADMIAMAKSKGLNPVDDNHCDAMALLAYALAQETDDPLREPELRSVPPAPLFVATA